MLMQIRRQQTDRSGAALFTLRRASTPPQTLSQALWQALWQDLLPFVNAPPYSDVPGTLAPPSRRTLPRSAKRG